MSDQATRSNPYVGPRAYEPGETLFGRDTEVQELFYLLTAERIVLLHSPSGAGKTSLIQAALVPRLAAEAFSILPIARVGYELPESAPAGANRFLLSTIISIDKGVAASLQRPIAELSALTLEEYLLSRPGAVGPDESEVLIFDQFEEILTVGPGEAAARAAFFTQLGAALRDRRRWALFAMREEYVAALEPLLRPVPTRLSNTFRLELLGPEAAMAAIQRPARAGGDDFTDEAARRLVDDLRRVVVQRPDGTNETISGMVIEPVQLQVVCYRLWERQVNLTPMGGRPVIDHEAIDEAGGVDEALENYYAERIDAITRATGEPERLLRDWCEYELIQAGELRGQVLLQPERTRGLANKAIEALIDSRLVRAEERRGTTWFELAHDRLIVPIRNANGRWREANLDLVQRQALLWLEQGRPEGLLLPGPMLVEAEAWTVANEQSLNPDERDFLSQSRKLEERRRRDETARRRFLRLAFAAAVVGLLALLFGVFAWNQWLAAVDAQVQAELARERAVARQLAVQSDAARGSEPQQSLLLAVEAVEANLEPGAVTQSGEQALRDSLFALGGQTLSGHEGAVADLAFRPETHTLASVGADGKVLLWDALRPNEPAQLFSEVGDELWAVEYSPDGRFLAVGDDEGRVLLWDDLEVGASPRIFPSEDDTIVELRFSPDGELLAAVTERDRLSVLVTGTGATLFRLELEQEPAELGFSADGRYLVVSGATIWDLQADQPTEISGRLLTGENERFSTYDVMAVSRDGTRFALASHDTIAVWEFASLSEPDPVYRLENFSTLRKTLALSFAFDDNMVIASDENSIFGKYLGEGITTSLLNESGLAAESLLESPRGTYLLAFASKTKGSMHCRDGCSRMVGSDPDRVDPIIERTAYLWPEGGLFQATARPLQDAALALTAAAFSSDERFLALASFDGTIRLRDLTADFHEPAKSIATAPVFSPTGLASVSPSGRYFVQYNEVDQARLAPVASPNEYVLLPGAPEEPDQIHFSPDERRVLIVDEENHLFLWATGDGTPQLLGQRDLPTGNAVSTLALDVAGERLIAGDSLGRIYLVDFAARQEKVTLVASEDVLLRAAAFRPGSAQFVVGDEEGRIRLFDPSRGLDEALSLHQHEGAVAALQFSPSGRWLASGGADGEAILIDLDAGEPAAKIIEAKPAAVTAVAFDASSTRLALGRSDGEVTLWLVSANPSPPDLLRGHQGAVSQIVFHPEKSLLVTSGSEPRLLLWDTGRLDQRPISLQLHGHTVQTMALNGGDDLLVAADAEGTLLIWQSSWEKLLQIACAVASRNLSWSEWQQYMGSQPYGETCPEQPLHPSLVSQGRQLARTGNEEEARRWFAELQRIDASLELDIDQEIRYAQADNLVERARRLAAQGYLTAAEELIREARRLNESLSLDPAGEARRIRAQILLDHSHRIAARGELTRAMGVLQESRELDPTAFVSANYWADLCVYGIIWGDPGVTIRGCDEAVAANSVTEGYREQRLVAYALLGDYARAQADLALLLKEADSTTEEARRERYAGWQAAFEAGRSPFGKTQLEELLREWRRGQ